MTNMHLLRCVGEVKAGTGLHIQCITMHYIDIMSVCDVRNDCACNGALHMCAVRRWLVLGACAGRAGMLVAPMGMHIPCLLAFVRL